MRRNVPEPFTLVIFGATGDLTHRRLIPAVYRLFREGLLPDDFSVIGFARREKSDDEFRAELRESVERFAPRHGLTAESWAGFAARLSYHRSAFEESAGFDALRERLEIGGAPRNRVFYLAVQPDSIGPVLGQLRDSGLARRGAVSAPWARVVVEKPFGRDLASARELNAELLTAFTEGQVFRIDHYLGKETVQNLLVLRFANSLFEPLWNQKYVDHVQVTVAETIGVEGRGRYYEQAGALRDIVQNHVMHLLCLVAMEPPGSLDADAVRDEKVKVIESLRRIPPECAANGVVRAQYTAGECCGQRVVGYCEEPCVAADSNTETFVAFKVLIDNWRWSGVPFYVRTGKRLAAQVTEISVHFKPVPQVLFNTGALGPMVPNVLTMRIQPDEGISLQFQVKVPGPAMRVEPFQMDFGYAESFGSEPPEAYERLLLDAALGDATLFIRSDEVDAAWAFVDPVVTGCALAPPAPLAPQALSAPPALSAPQALSAPPAPPATYPAGTWGPPEADALIAADGRKWHLAKRRAGAPGKPIHEL